jgi:hypothetical protein
MIHISWIAALERLERLLGNGVSASDPAEAKRLVSVVRQNLVVLFNEQLKRVRTLEAKP